MSWIIGMCTRPTFCTGHYLRTLRTPRQRVWAHKVGLSTYYLANFFPKKTHENERNWTQKGEMHLVNLLVKVSSFVRKRECMVKREGALFTTYTVFNHQSNRTKRERKKNCHWFGGNNIVQFIFIQMTVNTLLLKVNWHEDILLLISFQWSWKHQFLSGTRSACQFEYTPWER